MRRLGILPEEDAKAAALLADGRLKLGTVMSHLAAGDDESQDARTLDQLKAFANRVSSHFQGTPCHILNTAGAARAQAWLDGRPELDFLRDTIRIGLGMYGLAPHATAHGLTPALALTSVVSKLGTSPPGMVQDTAGQTPQTTTAPWAWCRPATPTATPGPSAGAKPTWGGTDSCCPLSEGCAWT